MNNSIIFSVVTFLLLTGCGRGESGAAPLAGIQIDKSLSPVCAGVFPDVLSSEQLIRFEETAKIEGSAADLRTPILEGAQGKVLCENKECKAGVPAPSILATPSFVTSSRTEILSVTQSTTFNASDLPNIIIGADNLTLTFDAPQADYWSSTLQKIASITVNGRNTRLIFKGGNYQVGYLSVVIPAGKPSLRSTTSITAEGPVKLLIRDTLSLKDLSLPSADAALTINASSSRKGTPDPSKLLIYVGGETTVKMTGGYEINALLYGYKSVSIDGDSRSILRGAVHATGALIVGDSKAGGMSGKFIYDPSSVAKLYKDVGQCSILPDDPGDAGMQTLIGIDTNRNGVRDDVEIYILTKYSSEKEQKALIQYAKVLQASNFVSTQEQNKPVLESSWKAINCVGATIGRQDNKSYIAMDDIDAKHFNTENRLLQQDRLSDLAKYSVFHAKKYGIDA